MTTSPGPRRRACPVITSPPATSPLISLSRTGRGTASRSEKAGSNPDYPGVERVEPSVSIELPPHVLRDYALVADGERGALIGPHGDLAWMCAPRWDSDAVFSSLVGGKGGYAVSPAGTRYVWGGYYEDGSLIWHNRWITTTGVIECRDALVYPADPHTAVILRRVIAVRGGAAIR